MPIEYIIVGTWLMFNPNPKPYPDGTKYPTLEACMQAKKGEDDKDKLGFFTYKKMSWSCMSHNTPQWTFDAKQPHYLMSYWKNSNIAGMPPKPILFSGKEVCKKEMENINNREFNAMMIKKHKNEKEVLDIQTPMYECEMAVAKPNFCDDNAYSYLNRSIKTDFNAKGFVAYRKAGMNTDYVKLQWEFNVSAENAQDCYQHWRLSFME
jgi:hypothetical protein